MKFKPFFKAAFLILPFIAAAVFFPSCASNALRAEEYFSIGMAYYEIGQNSSSNSSYYFQEAEKWLNRARSADKTMVASTYNLGRLAFENGRYEEAARLFESILAKDPDNVMALKAAAFSRIKNGNIEQAEVLYSRVLALIPESADDGYNYALVLFSLKKYENCEEVLNRYPFALEKNSTALLMLARAQKAQDKVEAADTYGKWAAISAAEPQGLYEYAQVLEFAGFYAKALEQYKAAMDALKSDTEDLKKSALRFEYARLLLTEDPENNEGITALTGAVTDGFSDNAAIETLLTDERITQAHKDEMRKILDNIKNKDRKTEDEDEARTSDSE